MATVEDLQKQLAALQQEMEAERDSHAAQKEAQSFRIKELEGRLDAPKEKKKGVQVVESKNTVVAERRGSTGATRTTTTTTTTTTALKSTPQRGASDTDSNPPPTPGSGGRARFSAKKSPGAGSNAGTPKKYQSKLTNGSTALQHSWDKFCVTAKDNFTPKELSLMSLDTIKNLLNYYNYSNPIEIAQIEAQWALIQDGEKAVMSPTPHTSPNNRARGFSPMPVKQDFDLRTTVMKPHLSSRASLDPSPNMAGSNPNSTGDRHRSPSYTGPSLGAKQVRDASPCDPNSGRGWKPSVQCKAAVGDAHGVFPYSRKVYPRGKDRSMSPNHKEITTYPEEQPRPYSSGKKLIDNPHKPYSRSEGLKMVTPIQRGEEKKRSIRHIPQKNHVIIG